MGIGAFPSAGAFAEAISGNFGGIEDIATATEVPFSEVSGGIASGLELASNRGSVRVEKICLFAGAVSLAGLEVIGDLPAGGKHSREEACSGRGADWGSAVELGEAGAFFGEAIDVWGELGIATEATEITWAEVIGEDEDDVWVRGIGGVGEGVEGKEKKSEQEECSAEYGDQSGWMKSGD